jgi:oligoendopeptidase F
MKQLVSGILLCLACTLAPTDSFAQAPQNDPRWQWDLQALFADQTAWEAERQRLLAEFPRIGAFKGRLGDDSQTLYEALRFVSDTYRAALRVYVYASLEQDEDLRDTAAQERNQLAEAMFARFTQESAWIDPELISIGDARIAAFLAEEPRLAPFRHELDDTLRQASHTLGAEAEQALSYFTQPFDAPSAIYSILANSDIPYPMIRTPEGEEVRLDSQGYGRLRSHPDAEFRKQVFDAFWGAWQQYRNSTGMVLNSHIQTQVALTKARHFDSMLQRELFSDNMPEAVYHTLVTEVNAALPTLHRYFRLRARMLGLEQLRYSDIYPPLVSLDKRFDIETSRSITLDAMAILGEDWVSLQRAAMDARWMHVFPQQGKRSGAYMQGSAYDVHPYLLLNHNDDFDSLSTFAHEWGHAMHTLYARQSQPFETASYATFIAEIPSTSLELILQQHMTRNAANADERLFYLGYSLENMRGTFFRQTMFAEFELALYEAVERGEALSGSRISEMYLEILRRYHGHNEGVVQIDELYGNEWMFVPHFYYNMYVFQYATSLTAGAALYQRIVEDGASGVENYKNLLRAGGSGYPYELLRSAGVDLATPAPYRAVIERMNAVMDDMEALLDSRASQD